MSQVAGIIFSNLNHATNTQLTADRTVAAIPFACRYRLVDFALSNMVNGDVSNINIITNYNYRSLNEHIGSGKDWDLARHGAGIRLLSPYQNGGTAMYQSKLEALVDVLPSLLSIKEEYVLICDSDVVCNIDIKDMLVFHQENEADITTVSVVPVRKPNSRYKKTYIKADANGRVKDIALQNTSNVSLPEVSLNIYLMSTNYLRSILAEASARKYTSLTGDIIMKQVGKDRVQRYLYTGYYAFVADFNEYYARSIELATNPEARNSLLGIKERPIYTNVHNTAPVKYGEHASVSGSMIADGCVIDGTVENCVLFRGVHVGAGSVIRNSVLLGNVYVGKNCDINCTVSEKDALITDGTRLSGCTELPFFIPKGKHI